jgi:RND family efflux transporter MFP subunit
VQFDASKTEQELAQDRVALKSAQAQIDEARAQGMLQQEQDTTAVMKAEYDVKSAKLDASKQEIVSRIEGAEANLKVDDAVQSLHEAQAKLKADKSQTEATVASGKHAREKALADVQRAESALQAMTLKAPASGVIGLVSMWHNGGVSPFKAGEQVWPGAPLVELPDLSSLVITAHVDETERGRLSLKEPASLQLDAIADRQFTGHIESIGTIATSDFSAGWPFPRNFDLQISVDQDDQRLRPGMNVQVTVIVDRVPNSISIPAQASFQREGHTVVYVWHGGKFVERTIQVARRNRDRVLIASGLQAGDRIALKDPTVTQ